MQTTLPSIRISILPWLLLQTDSHVFEKKTKNFMTGHATEKRPSATTSQLLITPDEINGMDNQQ